MNNVEKNKFLGMLYDILINEGIIKYEDKAKDLKEKKERLEKYLRKLKGHQDRDYKDGTEERINRIKQLYYDRYIIKESDIPDKYFENIAQREQDLGYGTYNLVNPQTEEDKDKRRECVESVIKAQKDSLDNWLNYFLSKDSSYLEMWAKVWAFHGMLCIGNLNVGKDGYERRSKTNTNPFVSFDAEILGRCVDLVKETFEKKELADEELKKLVSSGSFSKLYGMLLANKKQIKAETTEGVWIKYNRETEESIEEKLKSRQEPEYIRLYNSLQGCNTGWCTAGSRETAKEQILGGDFYVYYSKDKEGNFIIPRLAIRMEESNIREIRGIAENQNIESNMEEILEEKLKEFPGRDRYKRRVSDMKTLTTIYNKHLKKDKLTKEELIFLYEIYNEIDGFGYDKDPRIEEIKYARDKKHDLAMIFNCNIENIALNIENMHENQIYYKFQNFISTYGNVEGVDIPENVIDLEWNSLTSAKDLNIPESVEYLTLNGLTSAKDLNIPTGVKELYLKGLIDANDLNIPEGVEVLNLNSLTSANNLKLPTSIRSLYLNGLTSAENLNIPASVKYLHLDGLTSANGLNIPEGVIELSLNGLTNLKDLVFPDSIYVVFYRGKTFGRRQILELQRQENIAFAYCFGDAVLEEQRLNDLANTMARSRGIISNVLLISNIILFGILAFILTLLIIK